MKKQDQDTLSHQSDDQQQILRRLILSEILAPPLSLRRQQPRQNPSHSQSQNPQKPIK